MYTLPRLLWLGCVHFWPPAILEVLAADWPRHVSPRRATHPGCSLTSHTRILRACLFSGTTNKVGSKGGRTRSSSVFCSPRTACSNCAITRYVELNSATRRGPGIFSLGLRFGSPVCLFLARVAVPTERWDQLIFTLCFIFVFWLFGACIFPVSTCLNVSQPVIGIDIIRRDVREHA